MTKDACSRRSDDYRQVEMEHYRNLPGDAGTIQKAVWGPNKYEYGRAVVYEDVQRRDKNPHLFIGKLSPRGRRSSCP